MNGGRDRGQVVALAFVLAVGFAVVGLAVTQALVVPDQNADREFEHSEQVQEDMKNLRTSIVRAAQGRDQFPATITTGTQYEARSLLVNPSSPSGTLVVERYENPVSISNVQAVDAEARDVWDGSRSYQVASVVYRPGYNEYDSAPRVVYEHSVAVNEYPNGNVRPLSGQELIDGNDLSLIMIDGEMERTQTQQVTFRPEAMSRSDETIEVRSPDGDPITVTVPTRLSEETWESLLEEELDEGKVRSVSVTDDHLQIELEAGVTYDLSVTAIGMEESTVSTVGRFVTIDEGNATTVAEGTSHQVTFTVRDTYNNPVSGASVLVDQPPTGHVTGGPTASREADGALNVTTDDAGRATVTYHAPLNANDSVALGLDAPTAVTANLKGADGEPGEATAALGLRDTGDDAAGTWSRPLVTAVDPSPDGDLCALSDGFLSGLNCPGGPTDGVRVYFPTGTDTDADWELAVTDETGTTRTTAVDPSKAAADGTLVVGAGSLFGDGLPDSVAAGTGATVELRRGDSVVDEFAYTAPGSAAGPTTANGWNQALGEDEVAYRVADDGSFADTNRSTDWRGVSVNPDDDARALDLVGGGGTAVAENESRALRFRVVDQDGFPVYDAGLSADQPQTGYVTADGAGDDTVTVATDVTGRATVTYGAPYNAADGFAPASDSPAAVTATLAGDAAGDGTETAALGVSDTPAAATGSWPHPLVTAVDPSPDGDLCALQGSVMTGIDCTPTDTGLPPACDIAAGEGAEEVDTDRSEAVEVAESDIPVIDGVSVGGKIKTGEGVVTLGEGADADKKVKSEDGSILVGENASVDKKVKSGEGAVCVARKASVGSKVKSEDGLVALGEDATVGGKVKTENGDIDIGARAAVTKKVKTEDGDIDLARDVDVGRKVKTGEGDIDLARDVDIGRKVKTGEGDIDIARSTSVGGKVKSEDGDIDLSREVSVAKKVKTSEGSISIGQNVTVDKKVKTGGGDIELAANVSVGKKVKSEAGDVTVGPDSVVGAKVKTGDGDIDLGEDVEVGKKVKTEAGNVVVGPGTTVDRKVVASAGTITVCGDAEVDGKVKAASVYVADSATVEGDIEGAVLPSPPAACDANEGLGPDDDGDGDGDSGTSTATSEIGDAMRVHFPSGYDADATWTLSVTAADGATETVTLDPATATDRMLLVRGDDLFADGLPDDGARLELRRDGTTVDQFGYTAPDTTGATTTNGWTVTVESGEVAYRVADDGTFAGTNRSADWTTVPAVLGESGEGDSDAESEGG